MGTPRITGTIPGIPVEAQLEVSSIEIGAVEWKDDASDLRANVETISGKNRGLVDATLSGSLPPVANKSAAIFQTVTVAVAGTPVQGPSVAVPDGITLRVRLRVTQLTSPEGYIGNSSANVQVAATRLEIKKGSTVPFVIDNMDVLWFDSDTNGAVFELYAEQ
jgi:hypothetical protein